MNIDELNKLFIDINGPLLSAARYIYATQKLEDGLQFGASRNKHGAKKVEIHKEAEGYRITFIYFKPDYKNYTPPVKKIKYEEKCLSVQELRRVLNEAFNQPY